MSTYLDALVSSQSRAKSLATNQSGVDVDVSAADPPSPGQTLVATSATTAKWQPSSLGSSGTGQIVPGSWGIVDESAGESEPYLIDTTTFGRKSGTRVGVRLDTSAILSSIAIDDGTPIQGSDGYFGPSAEMARGQYCEWMFVDDGVAAKWYLMATTTPFGTDSGITPVSSDADTPDYGSAWQTARQDHKHVALTGNPAALVIGSAADGGLSQLLARADHVHAMPTLATGSADGFMASADKTKLDGIAPGGGVALTDSPPVDVQVQSATPGLGTTAARSDHVHNVRTGLPAPLAIGSAQAPGSSSALARADHVHATPAAGTAAGTVCAGNDTRLSDDRTASGIRTATTVVATAAAAAPSAGQTLVATGPSGATWQTPAGGVSFAAPVTLTIGGGNVTGVSVATVHADHQHQLPQPLNNPYVTLSSGVTSIDEFEGGSNSVATRGWTSVSSADLTTNIPQIGDIQARSTFSTVGYRSRIAGSSLLLQISSVAANCPIFYRAITGLSGGLTQFVWAKLSRSIATSSSGDELTVRFGLAADNAGKPDMNNCRYIQSVQNTNNFIYTLTSVVTGTPTTATWLTIPTITPQPDIFVLSNDPALINSTGTFGYICNSHSANIFWNFNATPTAPSWGTLAWVFLYWTRGADTSGPRIESIDYVRQSSGNNWIAS